RAREAVAAFLLEAAIFERDVRRDAHAAQRHLAAALRLCPHDAAVQTAYRAVGAEIARVPPAAPSAALAHAPAPAREREAATAPASEPASEREAAAALKMPSPAANDTMAPPFSAEAFVN